MSGNPESVGPQDVMAHIDRTLAGTQSMLIAGMGPLMSQAMEPVKQYLINAVNEISRVHKLAEEAGVKIPPPSQQQQQQPSQSPTSRPDPAQTEAAGHPGNRKDRRAARRIRASRPAAVGDYTTKKKDGAGKG